MFHFLSQAICLEYCGDLKQPHFQDLSLARGQPKASGRILKKRIAATPFVETFRVKAYYMPWVE